MLKSDSKLMLEVMENRCTI